MAKLGKKHKAQIKYRLTQRVALPLPLLLLFVLPLCKLTFQAFVLLLEFSVDDQKLLVYISFDLRRVKLIKHFIFRVILHNNTPKGCKGPDFIWASLYYLELCYAKL